jgi:hypothetical protein
MGVEIKYGKRGVVGGNIANMVEHIRGEHGAATEGVGVGANPEVHSRTDIPDAFILEDEVMVVAGFADYFAGNPLPTVIGPGVLHRR